MKHHLDCDIVKDLLPGYVEELSSAATKTAVEEHLERCEACKTACERMMQEGQELIPSEVSDDRQLFRKVKRRLNKKLKVSIVCSVVAVVGIAAAFQLLFNIPLKDVALSDIAVSANVYPLRVLADSVDKFTGDAVVLEKTGSEEVKISASEDDDSGMLTIAIPGLPNSRITITENAVEKCEYVTAVQWSSPYFLREIRHAEGKGEKGEVLYVSAFKTTLLNNRAEAYQQKMTSLEMRKISKIVFVDDAGRETTLWQE